MNFPQFTKAVDNLVDSWQGGVVITDKALGKKLQHIFNEVREQAVHDVARQWEEELKRTKQ